MKYKGKMICSFLFINCIFIQSFHPIIVHSIQKRKALKILVFVGPRLIFKGGGLGVPNILGDLVLIDDPSPPYR